MDDPQTECMGIICVGPITVSSEHAFVIFAHLL